MRLVFVNCCYSGVAAQHFVDAGIPHVVCSPLRLRDAAAAAFTRGLYMALAVGKTVAQAFAIAQACSGLGLGLGLGLRSGLGLGLGLATPPYPPLALRFRNALIEDRACIPCAPLVVVW